MEKQLVNFTPGQHLQSVVDIAIAILNNQPVGSVAYNMTIDNAINMAEGAVAHIINCMYDNYTYTKASIKEPETKAEKQPENLIEGFDFAQYPEGARYTDIVNFIKSHGITKSNRRISDFFKSGDGVFYKYDKTSKRFFPV